MHVAEDNRRTLPVVGMDDVRPAQFPRGLRKAPSWDQDVDAVLIIKPCMDNRPLEPKNPVLLFWVCLY